MEPLPWSTRVQIALDSARGLEYIHEHTVPVYIHRDIKSASILIDKNYRAKVAKISCSLHIFLIHFMFKNPILLSFSGCRFWPYKTNWSWERFSAHAFSGDIWLHASRVRSTGVYIDLHRKHKTVFQICEFQVCSVWWCFAQDWCLCFWSCSLWADIC